MKSLYQFDQFALYKLSEDVVNRYANDICASLNQIPLVEKHTKDQLLALQKGDRVLYQKFEHSLIALSQDMFVVIIIGYERKCEANNQYPENSIYLNDLAVSSAFQKMGVGKKMLDCWIDYNKKVGFLSLNGKVCFSVQTNSAGWNAHVQHLYPSKGFIKTATKKYNNRTDNIYWMTP